LNETRRLQPVNDALLVMASILRGDRLVPKSYQSGFSHFERSITNMKYSLTKIEKVVDTGSPSLTIVHKKRQQGLLASRLFR
jgi:hypothetical protein